MERLHRRVSGFEAQQIKKIEKGNKEEGEKFEPTMAKGLRYLPAFLEKPFKPIFVELERLRLHRENIKRARVLLGERLDYKDYDSLFEQVRLSKIEWVMSAEFERRFKRFISRDEDLMILRKIIRNNLEGSRVFILPPDNFDELIKVLENIDQLNGLGFMSSISDTGKVMTSAFWHKETKNNHVSDLQNSVVFKADEEGRVAPDVVSHELGHVGYGAVEEFQNKYAGRLHMSTSAKIKDGGPISEYIGDFSETDTRVRAMFNDLHDVFDPQTQTFGIEQLNILKEKFKSGKLNQDTVDLLEHYSDEDIIEIANTAPAI